MKILSHQVKLRTKGLKTEIQSLKMLAEVILYMKLGLLIDN